MNVAAGHAGYTTDLDSFAGSDGSGVFLDTGVLVGVVVSKPAAPDGERATPRQTHLSY